VSPFPARRTAPNGAPRTVSGNPYAVEVDDFQPALHPAVRPARESDLERIRELILDLAAYEHSLDQVRVSVDQLRVAIFSERPAAYALVAEHGDEVVGFALYFLNFSTWEGVHGIHLEDLYIAPEHRGRGLGKALLSSLASIAVTRGYARFEWAVLDWNTPSIDFYARMGAVPMGGWTVYRLSGEALRRAALAQP
jgi:GNAT superfamily N-acetyltransferase